VRPRFAITHNRESGAATRPGCCWRRCGRT